MKSYNKYRNIRVDTYSSKKEARRGFTLKLLERGGLIYDLKEHPRYKIKIGEIHICDYIGDFEYINEEGEKVVEDVKGMKRGIAYRLFRIKKSLMKAVNNIEILEI